MSLILAAALATTLSVQPACSWNRPGVDPFRGDPARALDHYRDIPAGQRRELMEKIRSGHPDDTVLIRRTSIDGRFAYDPKIRDMHFGATRMCGSVDRSQWQADRTEPGAVYCSSDHCILVPGICGNVSRIGRSRTPAQPGGVGQASHPAAPAQPGPPAWIPEHLPPGWTTTTEVGLAGGPPALFRDDAPLPADVPYIPAPPMAAWRETPTIPGLPVPEASTWAMLSAGLGMLALWSRRRRA